jgi:hypothetical protein
MNIQKLCECGCGKVTSTAKQKISELGLLKGEYRRFIQGHNSMRGDKAYAWRGGRIGNGTGYMNLYLPDHPRAVDGYVLEHRVIAEKVLGKQLSLTAVIHHINEKRSDNSNNNLMICEDENYHKLIHRRMRDFKACGNANFRRCQYCLKYDDPKNLAIRESGGCRHAWCHAAYNNKSKYRNGYKEGSACMLKFKKRYLGGRKADANA